MGWGTRCAVQVEQQATPCVAVLGEFRVTLAGVPINHAGAHLNLTGYRLGLVGPKLA